MNMERDKLPTVIELGNEELDAVAGGRGDYLIYRMTEVFVTSIS
jgi:hypothetical protein